MASVWALLLFLALLHTLLYTSTAHRDDGNLTRHSVPFLCRPDQAEALLQLKKSFFVEPLITTLPSWGEGTDCCLWEGVGCDTSSGNVIVLDLNHQGLSSYGLDSAIFNLTSLRHLDLSANSFFGEVPDTIGELKELTSLVLGSCNFFGSIPSSIFNLTKLTILDLSYNSLTGEIRVFNNVSSQLEIVLLNENELSGSIPKALFRLKRLIHLDICWNNLTGSVDLTSFWRLRRLTELYLSYNNLSVMEGGHINLLSNNMSGLTRLGLASCNLNSFPESLALMNHLSFLDLSLNNIIGEVPKWIWESSANSLSYLDLSYNLLTNMQLTSDILPLTNALDTLDLSFNGLQGRIPMPESSARVLDYSNNRFSSVLPNLASYLARTRYISMSNNSINGRIPASLCNSMLDVLDLSHNSFIDPIPSCLFENSLVLNLRENQFEGMLPSNFTSCALQALDLHGNKIGGQLPRGLSNCFQLTVLDFGSNRIVDIFPSWLSGHPRLSILVLRSNKFYGTIGDAIGGHEEFFPSLRIIDLASNYFSGILRPQWIERLELMKAKFDDNTDPFNGSFHGFVSGGLEDGSVEIMGKGSEMTFKWIGSDVRAIDFSNNRLEGDILESIGRLVSLNFLNLSHNAFTGKIPAQLGSITDLESLDLSGNKLSGVIPQELTNLTFLEFLNLSGNHLVGKIPQSRQFSTFDSSSFEGNAGLCGPPLSESPCGASPYTPYMKNEHKSSHHVDVILFLFVGLGYGVGFAAAILLKWGQIGRWINATARALRT